MTSLLKACENAFSNDPKRFRVIDESGEIPLNRRDFSQFAGQRVLWPLESHADAIGHFLGALLDGVKPMLVSPKTMPGKLQQLQARYQAALYQNGSVTSRGNQAIDPSPSLLYVMTSGSTGLPKAIAACADRLGGMIQAIHESQRLQSVKSVLASLPLGFSSGLINQLLWAVY